jgi:Rieske 2Fe-2S family protein
MAKRLTGDEDFAGLKSAQKTLPAEAYYDPAVYQRELSNIWFRHWVYLCRADALEGPGAFRTEAVGDQSVLLLRDVEGAVRAFHNTCRHRGSRLCLEHEGRFRAKAIVCPYHQWSYDFQGNLLGTSSLSEAPDFAKEDFPLYRIAVKEWRGCVFVCLDDDPPAEIPALRGGSDYTENWPLADLVSGHAWRKVVDCNWKVFWENFNECLHCPSVHPELSALVPIYKRRIILPQDDPDWRDHKDSSDPKHRGGLRDGAETWSGDGQVHGARFEGLSEAEREAGARYYVNTPSVYIAAHLDYMRIVRLLPLGPEQTELRAEWLFPAETLADPAFDLANVVDFGKLVMEQDGEISAINQKGLHALAHRQGVLMPEEHYVALFYRWYRQAMGGM